MSEMVGLTPDDIRQLAGMIADQLEKRGIKQINVEQADHWLVWFEDAFDLSQKPEPVIGSALDAVQDLRKEFVESRDPESSPTLWHACHHFAEVLSLIAYQDIKGEIAK